MVAVVKEIQVNGGEVVKDLAEVVKLTEKEGAWKLNFQLELPDGSWANITFRQVSEGRIVAYGNLPFLGTFLDYSQELELTGDPSPPQ